MIFTEYFIDPAYCKEYNTFVPQIPILVRTQVNDIYHTWVLCCCESMDFARYLVNRLNKISKEAA